MKRAIIVSVGLLCAVTAAAQGEEAALRAAMYLNGASSEEELQADEIERLQILGKVRVNSPGRNARAILSEYQLAALEDYRRHNGDILSWEELALVDGFGKEAVEALKPYLSLWSKNLPGAVDTLPHFKADLLVRATEKNIGSKLKADGKSWQVAGAARSKAWGSRDYDWTASAEVDIGPWSILAGDFNVRYGQGTGIWSGFAMTSLSTVDAFIRRPSGITPVCSFLPSQHRGMALLYRQGRYSAEVFADINRQFGAHLSYLALHGRAGMTVMPGMASADFAANWKGVEIVGDAAVRFPATSAAGKLAGRFKIGSVKMALQGRALPSQYTGKKNGEYGAAAGAQWQSPKWRQLAGRTGFGSSVPEHRLSLTADASLLPIPQTAPNRRQLRIYAKWQWQVSPVTALSTYYSGRYRNWEPSRNSLRLDVGFASAPWLSNARLEGVLCNGKGLLGYLEAGRKQDNLAAYLRLGAFSISAWSARIYCYERDAPGTFNVPAYNGNGLSGSLYGSWKCSIGPHIKAKLCLRAAYTVKEATKPVPSIHLQLQTRIM